MSSTIRFFARAGGGAEVQGSAVSGDPEILAEIFAEGIAGHPGRTTAARERIAKWEDCE